MPGLELRVTAEGVRSWAVRTYVRGRRIRVTLDPVKVSGLAEARESAREIIREAARGVDPRRPRGNRLTVEQLGREALAELTLKPSTLTAWSRLLDAEIIPALGKLAAEDLDRKEIRRWGSGIVKRGSPYTAINAFEALRRIYSWGVSRDKVRGTPFVDLEAPASRSASTRVLSTDELREVWRALWLLDHLADYSHVDRAYVDATRLLILTAARREMVIGMRRSELEALDRPEARWIIPGPRMKGGRDHVVPLSHQALEVVRRRLQSRGSGRDAVATPRRKRSGPPEQRDDLLFPAGRGAAGPMTWSSRFARDLRDLVDTLLKRKAPRWTIHNIRHTAATHMVEDLHIDPQVVSLILSHRPPGAPVTRIYQRAERLAERRDALNRWASWVQWLLR